MFPVPEAEGVVACTSRKLADTHASTHNSVHFHVPGQFHPCRRNSLTNVADPPHKVANSGYSLSTVGQDAPQSDVA